MINRILERKYFSEYINGTTFADNVLIFSSNLKGNIMERKKAVHTIEIAHELDTKNGVTFSKIDATTLGRSFGSFSDESWFVGQNVQLIKTTTGAVELTATITTITDDRVVLNISAGAIPVNLDDMVFVGTDIPQFLYHNYNFVENSDQATYDDKGYYGTGSLTPIAPKKAWIDGTSTLTFVSSSKDYGGAGIDYIHKFTVDHIFVVPFFHEDYRDTFFTQPPQFLNTNSIRYVANYQFRYIQNDPNKSITATDTDYLGSVGWYGENNNGKATPYSITALSYGLKDRLQAGAATTVTFRLLGTNFTALTKIGLYHGAKNSVVDETKDFFENTLYASNFLLADSVPVVGPAQIGSCTADFVSATEIDITMSVTASPAIAADGYVLGVQTGVDIEDKAIIMIDSQNYDENTDIAGLLSFNELTHYRHEQDTTQEGKTDYKGFVEDGVLTKFDFDLTKLDDEEVTALEFQYIAYHPADDKFFIIQDYKYDLSTQVIVNTAIPYQALTIDAVRGFNLAPNNPFNDIKLQSGPVVANAQNWTGEIAWRVDWTKEQALVGADTIFYDAGKPFNGLNKNSSNYIGNGYQLVVAVLATVESKGVQTIYRRLSPAMEILDYDSTAWTQVVSTFDAAANDLGGIILADKDTTFVIEWFPPATPFEVLNVWATHSLHIGQNLYKLSSLRDTYDGNKLFGDGGNAPLLEVEVLADRIRTTCKIKAGSVDTGECYNLSGRIDEQILPFPLNLVTINNGDTDVWLSRNPTWDVKINDPSSQIVTDDQIIVEVYVGGNLIANANLKVGSDITTPAGVGAESGWLTGAFPLADYITPTSLTALDINAGGASFTFNKVKWAMDTGNLGVNKGVEMTWTSASSDIMTVRRSSFATQPNSFSNIVSEVIVQYGFPHSYLGFPLLITLDLIDDFKRSVSVVGGAMAFSNSMVPGFIPITIPPLSDPLYYNPFPTINDFVRFSPEIGKVDVDIFFTMTFKDDLLIYPEAVMALRELSMGSSWITSTNGGGIKVQTDEIDGDNLDFRIRFFVDNTDNGGGHEWGLYRGTNVDDASDNPATRVKVISSTAAVGSISPFTTITFPSEGTWYITGFLDERTNVNFESGNNPSAHSDVRITIFSY